MILPDTLSGRRSVSYSEMMARSAAIQRIDVRPEVIHAIFSTDSPDHAFDQEPLQWGFGLAEGMATKALAKFLSAGSGATRARRVRAFLQAVGLPEDCASLDALQRCVVVAEEDRINLKIVWIDDAGKDVVVIIEAKFGYKITGGQLAAYRSAVKRKHGAPSSPRLDPPDVGRQRLRRAEKQAALYLETGRLARLLAALRESPPCGARRFLSDVFEHPMAARLTPDPTRG